MSNRPPQEHRDLIDLSRRGFLKGAGVAAAGAVLAGKIAQAQQKSDDGLVRLGPGAVPVELKINGGVHKVELDPRTTLLDALREKLDLTGPKEVCSRGACGGCNVFLDGVTVNACMTLALDAVGHEVTTIEGLAKGDQLDPVQAAFCKHDGMQCGYCTPGLIMSVRGLLNHNAKPTLDDVKDACSGNICRCGTYPKVFESALAAAGVEVPVGNFADNKDKCLESTGGRVDGPQKVTGKAKYTTDVNLGKLALATIIYCPFGRATLKSHDKAAAEKVPGVIEVVVEGARKSKEGEEAKSREFKYCGQPCGHIIAETKEALNEARLRLNLQWNILEPVVDPIAEHEKAGPLPPPLKGDGDGAKVTDALKDAKHIVERTYTTQIQTHTCLEPHSAVADFRGEEAEFWCSTQANAGCHDEASGAFGIDSGKVKSHCEFVGGGFGSKFGIDREGQLAIELSKKHKRPIKIVNTRKREHLDTGCRGGSIQYMKFGADQSGAPQAGQIHIVGVAGVGGGGNAANPAQYKFGTVARTFKSIELSVGQERAMRAPGKPQGAFAYESLIDELAEAAGVDPLALRKQIDPNATRQKMYDVGAERIGWANRPKPDGAGKGRFKRGIGVGVTDWGNSGGQCGVAIKVHRDGSVMVTCGTQDIGTGAKTLLTDLVANHLKIDRKLVTGLTGSSEFPKGPMSGGSMTSRIVAPAARDAAQKALDKLKEMSEQSPTDTESWLAACKKMGDQSFTVIGSHNKKYWGDGGSEGVQFAEVEVDVETGVVRLLKIVAIQACGQPVNRLTAENQVIGGVIQASSFALFEEKLIDPKTGAMLNPNMEMYKVMGPMDCPEIIPILWAEGKDLGVRSLGEPPAVPTAGAIANAVANAIGARVRSLPITPAKVLAALAERGGVA